MKALKEPAILLALYMTPAIAGITGSAHPAFSAGALVALIFRNAAFALLVLYLFERCDRTFPVSLGGFDKKSVITLIPNALIVMTILFVAAALTRLVFPVAIITDVPIPRMAPDQPGLFRIPLIVTTILIVSFTEELFFRAYLLDRFREAGAGPLVAVVTGATLFAVGHSWQGPEAVVFSWLAGCTLGVFWLRNPRLFVLFLGHAGYNLLALLISPV